jgi:hypothetical protein
MVVKCNRKSVLHALFVGILCSELAPNVGYAELHPIYMPTNMVVTFSPNQFEGFISDTNNIDPATSNVVYHLTGQMMTNAESGILEISTNTYVDSMSVDPWASASAILNGYKQSNTNLLFGYTAAAGLAKMKSNYEDPQRRSAIANMFQHLTGAVAVIIYEIPPQGIFSYVRLKYDTGDVSLSPFLWILEDGRYKLMPLSGRLNPREVNMSNAFKTNLIYDVKFQAQ